LLGDDSSHLVLVFIHPPTPSVNTNANREYHE